MSPSVAPFSLVLSSRLFLTLIFIEEAREPVSSGTPVRRRNDMEVRLHTDEELNELTLLYGPESPCETETSEQRYT